MGLGAESVGRFAVYQNGRIYLSEDFGDLTENANFSRFKKSLTLFIKKRQPEVILTDLHPLYQPTIYGQQLAKRLKIPVIKIQHHLAHIFASFGEYVLTSPQKPSRFIGVACDGTGYGLDRNIWGGEIFQVSLKNKVIKRAGHLENQLMPGGDLAVREPARMLLSILTKSGICKETIWSLFKKFYTKNEFEVIYNQIKQNVKINLQKKYPGRQKIKSG